MNAALLNQDTPQSTDSTVNHKAVEQVAVVDVVPAGVVVVPAQPIYTPITPVHVASQPSDW